MLIYPAIDLRGGKCVRLRQGDFARETVFGDDPAAVARRWVDAGATYLHIVDLDGAREGRPVNGDAIQAVVRACGVPCQLGGGLRDESHLRAALDMGVSRVILGTKALEDPAWCHAMIRAFPDKVAVGIDVKNGRVATDGWTNVSKVAATDLAKQFTGHPVAAIIYTDISVDGTLSGPNVEATAALARAVPTLAVIASGGVASLDHVARLARAGLPGCIIGRALYEGQLDVKQAIERAAQESPFRRDGGPRAN